MPRLRRYLILAACKLLLTIAAGAQTTEPSLIQPAKGARVESTTHPLFLWKPGSGSYRFRLVRLDSHANPESALDTGQLLLDLTVAGSVYQYSPLDPRLAWPGPRRYAWSVAPLDDRGREMVASRVVSWFLIDPVPVDPAGGDTGTTRSKTLRPAVRFGELPVVPSLRPRRLEFSVSNLDQPATLSVTLQSSTTLVPVELVTTLDDSSHGSAAISPVLVDGMYMAEVLVTLADGCRLRDRMTVVIGDSDPPETGSPMPLVSITARSGDNLTMVTDADVADAERRAREAGASAEAKRQERDRLEDRRNQAAVDADSAAGRQSDLVAIDRVLDRVPAAVRPQLDSLQRRLDSLRNSLGGSIDTAALDSAVSRARQRRDDCLKSRQDLERERQDLESERDRLKTEQDALLKQMDALHPSSEGWNGSSGYRPDGTVHWGYVKVVHGSGELDNDHLDRYYDLRAQIRSRNKDYKATLRRLEEIGRELVDNDRDCDERAQALVEAEDARLRGDQAAALQTELDEACRQLRALLSKLRAWCHIHPDLCDWNAALESLIRDCPEGAEGWASFWEGFAGVLAQKQEREREQGARRDSLDREVSRLDSGIVDTEKEIREEENREDEEWDRARRLRDQQARDAMDRRREEEQARRNGESAEIQRRADCQTGFARWIAANQQYVDQSDLETLQRVVDGAQIVADAAGSFAGSTASGSAAGVAGMNAVAGGLFSLGTSLFYAWMENSIKGGVKQLADRHVLNILGASLLGDRRSCGVIQGYGLDGRPSSTSYYFFRKGNQVLVFRISSTNGFECLGVTSA